MKTPTPDIKEMAQECDEIVDNLINAMNMSLTFDDKEKAQGMRYHIATIFVSRIFVKAANGNIDTLIALNGDFKRHYPSMLSAEFIRATELRK